MKQINLMPLACWVVALLLLVAPASAAEQPKPAETPKPAAAPRPSRQQLKAERLISDNTFLFAATPDLHKVRSAFERTAFQALLREDEVAQPILTAFAQLRDGYVKGDGTRSEPEMRRRANEIELLLALAPLLQNQVALAVEGDISSLLASGTLPRFLFVAAMPPGDEGEEWRRQVEEAMRKHQARQGIDNRFKDSEDRVGNYDLARLENSDLGITEAWAFVENLFLYGQGKRIVEDAIERYALKNGTGTLALHAGYQDAYKQAGRDGGGEAMLYLQADMRLLLRHFLASYPAVQKALEPKMAVLEANRPHFAMGVTVGEGENAAIREKVLLRLNKDALPKSSGPCDSTTARFVQNNALFFSTMQGNLADLYKSASEFYKVGQDSEKPPVAGTAPAADKDDPLQLKRAMGVQNEAELLSKLELFKGEFSVSLSYQPQPNLKLDSLQDYLDVLQPVFVLELDRESAVAETTARGVLTKVQESSGHQYLPTQCGLIQINYQKGAVPPETPAATLGLFRNLLNPPSENKPPFFVSVARADLTVEGGKVRKFLLLSDSLDALKTAARVADPKFSHTSLAEDKKFRDLSRSFRESRVSLSYLDLPRLATVYADMLPRLARSGSVRPEQLDRLPRAGTLREHVFPMAWATSVLSDPDGLLSECSSPLGNLPMLGVVGAVGWPAIIERQQQSVSDDVDVRFRRIKLALHLYAASFNRFPSQLSDVYPNFVDLKEDRDKLRLFESPFRRGELKSPENINNPELTNLVYIANHSLRDLGSDILLYEKEPTKLVGGSVVTAGAPRLFYHVLTLDDKKAYMRKDQLERVLSGKAELPGMSLADQPKEAKK